MSYIEFRNVTKSFGTFTACHSISISIEKSQIHSIIGENGAGKSTLMKLLGGIEDITSGELYVNGRFYKPESAQDAFKNKIAFIHQHFVLAEQLTALDNLVLSYSSNLNPLKVKNTSEVKNSAENILKRFHWSIDLNKPVYKLSVGEQQRLEILKALLQEPDIIIFDEPTAVLTPQESEELMQFILQLKRENKTIILISHKLNEIKSVSDKISILRQGRLVHSEAASNLSIENMAELMIGRQVVKAHEIQRKPDRPILFKIPKTSITLLKSEILGVAGIEGNGQRELIETLLKEFKAHKLHYGDITEDRIKLSVFEGMNLCEHMLLKHKNEFLKNGFIFESRLHKVTEDLVTNWDVRPPDIKKSLSEFSGGNQQKFVVGRELWNHPEVLLAAHPTRGVDLGAQEKIHKSLLEFSKESKTVVLISSDLNEVLYLSDRYVILNKHKIYGPFNRGELNEQQIGLIMAAESGGGNAVAGEV
jgi:simple sugar transport system ATP-binding protein